jgi:hypothetical protein
MTTYLNGQEVGSDGMLTKVLTGTLDNDASTNIAHGLLLANIRSVDLSAYNGSAWCPSGSIGLGYTLDATNIVTSNGAAFNAQAYKVVIKYTA